MLFTCTCIHIHTCAPNRVARIAARAGPFYVYTIYISYFIGVWPRKMLRGEMLDACACLTQECSTQMKNESSGLGYSRTYFLIYCRAASNNASQTYTVYVHVHALFIQECSHRNIRSVLCSRNPRRKPMQLYRHK